MHCFQYFHRWGSWETQLLCEMCLNIKTLLCCTLTACFLLHVFELYSKTRNQGAIILKKYSPNTLRNVFHKIFVRFKICIWSNNFQTFYMWFQPSRIRRKKKKSGKPLEHENIGGSEINTEWFCMKLMGQIFFTFGIEVKTSEQGHGHMVISTLLVCVSEDSRYERDSWSKLRAICQSARYDLMASLGN